MEDRLVQYPNRVQLIQVDGQPGVYDVTEVPGTITSEGTPLNKANLLSDSVSALTGNSETPNDALQYLASRIQPIEFGGTSADTPVNARVNLGFTYGTTEPSGTPSTGEGSVYFMEDDGSPLPIEEGGTNATTVEEILANLGIADFVIERGTSGIWTYEKWASGKVVCYGYDTQTVACTTTYGNLYGGSTTISLPSGLFVSSGIDSIHVTAGGSTGSGYAFFGRYASATNTRFSALFLSTASASKDITFSAEVIGKWK